MDIDKSIETLLDGKCLKFANLKKMCKKAKEILQEEPNVVQVKAPVIVCGDIHGQLYDLKKLFEVAGKLPNTQYLFMGDYVDRGYYQVEVMSLLLCYKIKYPKKIWLLRGNHECREITKVYGFFEECQTKYKNIKAWEIFCSVFDLLPLAGLINNQIFCVHGGLSPDLYSLDDINTIERNKEIPEEGVMSDLLWSDPEEDAEKWTVNSRGAGYSVCWQFNICPPRPTAYAIHQNVRF